MGNRSLAVIHCEPSSPWQPRRAEYFAEGFRRIGLPYRVTNSRQRFYEGFPILLGTTFWRDIERDGGQYLLVDRCSFGDTERFVSLVWNAHGRRGDHRVPHNFDGSRWQKYGVPMKPWQTGSRIIVCGQTETYSPRHRSIDTWLQGVPATHLRPHPAAYGPAHLPIARDWSDCALAVTLNSSVGVQSVLEGVPTVTMDEGAMAWDVTSHHWGETKTPDRQRWAEWLAWTQWTDDEIREGTPWASLL